MCKWSTCMIHIRLYTYSKRHDLTAWINRLQGKNCTCEDCIITTDAWLTLFQRVMITLFWILSWGGCTPFLRKKIVWIIEGVEEKECSDAMG